MTGFVVWDKHRIDSPLARDERGNSLKHVVTNIIMLIGEAVTFRCNGKSLDKKLSLRPKENKSSGTAVAKVHDLG